MLTNELFQWEDRTLMCVEFNNDSDCDNCKMKGERCRLISCDTVEGIPCYFTNKLIFQADGIKLQVKRKNNKVKVKVLELSEEFNRLENIHFEIFRGNLLTMIHKNALSIEYKGDKASHTFPTDQLAIDWVNNLFSLKEEVAQ